MKERRGDRHPKAMQASTTGRQDNSATTHADGCWIHKPCIWLFSIFARISTPDMVAPLFDTGTGKLSPKPEPHEPTSTYLSRKTSAGTRPVTTGAYGYIRKLPGGPT